MGGQDAVVVVVVAVLGLVGDNVNGNKPLDHPSPDVSGYDETDWEAVIGLENLSVGLVGDGYVVGWIHGPDKGDRHAIIDELSQGFLFEGSGLNLVGEVLLGGSSTPMNSMCLPDMTSPHYGLAEHILSIDALSSRFFARKAR